MRQFSQRLLLQTLAGSEKMERVGQPRFSSSPIHTLFLPALQRRSTRTWPFGAAAGCGLAYERGSSSSSPHLVRHIFLSSIDLFISMSNFCFETSCCRCGQHRRITLDLWSLYATSSCSFRLINPITGGCLAHGEFKDNACIQHFSVYKSTLRLCFQLAQKQTKV